MEKGRHEGSDDADLELRVGERENDLVSMEMAIRKLASKF